jgi:type I restriction enzyme, S subunit
MSDTSTNPRGWRRCTLGEVAVRVTDGTHQSPEWCESGIPFLFVSNIRDRQIDFRTTRFVSEDEHRRLTARCPIDVGDVLYTTVGSYGNPARVREGTGRFAFQRHIAHIKPNRDLIDPQFLELMLDSRIVRTQADRLARGVAQKTLNLRELKSFAIVLPPLAEQKRIAGILDAADALRAKRRESLAQLDLLLQSTFLDMFGDPVTNPMGWEIVQIQEIGSVQGGLQVTSKRRSLPIEQPYLRVANVFRGYLLLDEIKTIRLTKAEELRTMLEDEDILIVEGHGNKKEIGRCARWDGSIKQCVHQNHLIRLRCDRSMALPLYVESYMNSEGGRRGLTGTSRTTSGLNTISVSKVKSAAIALPPLSLQRRFAASVESVERQKARQRGHLAELDSLFASLQQRAFAGEL